MITAEELTGEGYNLVGATMYEDCRNAIERLMLFVSREDKAIGRQAEFEVRVIEQEAGKSGHKYLVYAKRKN